MSEVQTDASALSEARQDVASPQPVMWIYEWDWTHKWLESISREDPRTFPSFAEGRIRNIRPLYEAVPCSADALAKLAEIPAVGSEERERVLDEAGRQMADASPGSDWHLSDDAIFTLMSEARKQGQRDVLGASASPSGSQATPEAPTDPRPTGFDPSRWELSEETRAHLKELDLLAIRPGDPRLNDPTLIGPAGPAIGLDGYGSQARPMPSAFAAANPSGGWKDISDAPKDAASLLISDGHNVGEGFWHDGNDCYRAEAGWFWEMDRGDLLTAKNAHATHWQPMPVPPSALAGEARQGQDAQRLDPKDDHAASSEATPSLTPPHPEPSPDPIMTVEINTLRERVAKLEEALRWYVTNDDVGLDDPENQFWIDGYRRAEALLSRAALSSSDPEKQP